MEHAKIVNGNLKLPQAAVRWIGRENELVVSVLDDALVLKKISPRRLTEFAEHARDDLPMPMSEIVAEVKKVRKAKKRARRS